MFHNFDPVFIDLGIIQVRWYSLAYIVVILFGWLSDQTYFKELTNMDIRQQLWKEKEDLVDQDMAPFGFVLDGVSDEYGEKIGETIDEYGSRFSPVVQSHREWLEDW